MTGFDEFYGDVCRKTDGQMLANRQTDRQTVYIHVCFCTCVMCVCVCERMSDQVVCSCSGRDERERTGSCSQGDRWTAMLWTRTHTHSEWYTTVQPAREHIRRTPKTKKTHQHACRNERTDINNTQNRWKMLQSHFSNNFFPSFFFKVIIRTFEIVCF